MHSLTLGSLLLTDSLPDEDHGFVFNVVAEGTSFGVAKGVQEIVRTLLADGDKVRITRYGNREVTFRVQIQGPSLGATAEGEKALRRQLGTVNTLTWQAPDVLAFPTVFDVVTSEMSQVFNDLDESMRRLRTFEVTLTCRPWARSATLTTYPAVETTTSTPTVIDDCSSATGWTATIDGVEVTPSVVTGSVRAQDMTFPKSVQMRRGGTVAFGSQRYLIVEVSTNSRSMDAYAQVGATAKKLPQMGAKLLSSGWLQYVFDTAGATVSSLTFVVAGLVYGDKGAPTRLWINDVSRATTPPQTSPRQLTRVLTPGGTERTPASIHVSSGTSGTGLGLTIVHTSPETDSGYSPSLRRWRVSGNAVTAASDTFSGFYEPIHASPVVFEVPAKALPEGPYVLPAALKTDTVGTYVIKCTAETILPSGAAGTEPFVRRKAVQFFTTGWHFASLCSLTLPTMRGNDGSLVRISIQFEGPQPPTIILDDAWAFRTDDDCALTVVNSTPQHLWIDSPGVSTDSAEVAVSTLSDRSDQWHPGASLRSTGSHYLTTGGTALFVASRDFDNPMSEGFGYDCYHSNAAS